jgi:hypothetical protein
MVMPPMAQISGTVRPLKRETRIAAITSSISAPRLVPAASAQINAAQAGSCASGSSSIPRARCRGGAAGGNRSLSSSIHTTRRSTNSCTGVGSPKLSWRDGQITTTCHWRIGRPWRCCCCNKHPVSALSRNRKSGSGPIWASRINAGNSG